MPLHDRSAASVTSPSEVCSDVFMCTEYIKKKNPQSIKNKTNKKPLLCPILHWQLELVFVTMTPPPHTPTFFFFNPCNRFSRHVGHLRTFSFYKPWTLFCKILYQLFNFDIYTIFYTKYFDLLMPFISIVPFQTA